jgi:hypothetical protein
VCRGCYLQALSNLEVASNLKERAAVLRKMMVDCPGKQMKYLVMIILKDLKARPLPRRREVV